MDATISPIRREFPPGLQREHISIVEPDAAKRYKLHINQGAIHRQTVLRLKECLAAASSCRIPVEDMVLKRNGVPLVNNTELCGSLGIHAGVTLTVERAKHSNSSSASATMHDNHNRRLMEVRTLEEQERYVRNARVSHENSIHHMMARADSEAQEAQRALDALEQQRLATERHAEALQQRQLAASLEKQRLADVRAAEAEQQRLRTIDLAARRSQLSAEAEAVRAVAALRLENERKKALIAQQRSELSVERERVRRTQSTMEEETKVREVSLRTREVELELARATVARTEKELAAERLAVLRQRMHYYQQLGLSVPAALADEAARAEEAAAASRRSNSIPMYSEGNRGVPHLATPPPLQRRPTAHVNSLNHGTHAYASRRSVGGESAVRIPNDDNGGAYYYPPFDNARENLRLLAEDLGLADPLVFDENSTCVLSVEGEYTLLFTYDAATERLFMYSTLLTCIPAHSSELRLKLYEHLMDNALLGRDMCGGGISTSLRDGFVLLSTSLHMPTSQPWALRTTTPLFVGCLQHWRQQVKLFLAQHGVDEDGEHMAEDITKQQPHTTSQSPHSEEETTSGQPSPARRQLSDFLDPLAMEDFTLRRAGPSSRRMSNATMRTPFVGRPVLGLEVTSRHSSLFNGVLVSNVAGPALAAGVQPRDVILFLNHHAVDGVAAFRRVVADLEPGQRVVLGVLRDGEEVYMSLIVGTAAR